ncbi:MAG: CpaF family protein [Candidatus Omnitrophota bacterium]
MDGEIKAKIHEYLIQKTDFLSVKDKLSEDQLRVYVDRTITEICREHSVVISTEDRIKLIRDLVSGVVSLGPIRPLMEDPAVSEIMINGAHTVYVQRSGRIELADVKFNDNNHLSHTIQKILAASGSNKRVDESSPYVDFSLESGARVNVVLPPCSLAGPVVTIRKFSTDISKIEDLLARAMLDEKMSVLLIAAMKAKLNVVFCGSTGTGKTTALNVLSRYIPEYERILTIEDTPELRLMQKHVVPLQSKPANIEGKGVITIRELFVNSLRMRPDRVIIGEVRGDEMLDLIQAISSGHSGSLAIVHADSPEDCFSRMVTMMLMTGIRLSTEEIKRQIANAIDLIVHIELHQDGMRRITNITDMFYDNERERVVLNDIFSFQEDERKENGAIIGHWAMNNKKPSFYKKFLKRNVKLPQGFFV